MFGRLAVVYFTFVFRESIYGTLKIEFWCGNFKVFHRAPMQYIHVLEV